MWITHASPSSINTYKECAWKYFLKYTLGLKDSTGKAALRGKIIHKVLENMSRLKKRNKQIDPLWLLDRAFDHFTYNYPEIELKQQTSRGEAADFRHLRECIETVMADDYYCPYNLHIIDVEKSFIIKLSEDQWIITLLDGSKIPFEVNGIIDLVHEIDKDTIEIIDWKTGQKKDFVTGKDLDTYELLQAVQPRLYHWAASILYPQYKNILVTFYYIEKKGPEMLSFGEKDITATIEFVYRFMEIIKQDRLMKRKKSWRCNKMCFFGKNGECNEIYSDLNTRGLDYVVNTYMNLTPSKRD